MQSTGAMAEWLGTGLQNLLQRSDSASHLQQMPLRYLRGIFNLKFLEIVFICFNGVNDVGLVPWNAKIEVSVREIGLLTHEKHTSV